MLFLTPILVAVLAPSQAPIYRVVEAHRTIAFAGRLGQRVEDRLVVSSNGERYEVLVARRHTAMGTVSEFHAGDEIRIGRRMSGHAVRVLPDQIRVVRT